ncbi:hypothetical protein L2D14_11975 [Thalassospiraceae bacterium LMO-JJ14]|nr:hypothetical protein L2D14_11975 [Thalassospiraceae bacterium LMO-JJ14]
MRILEASKHSEEITPETEISDIFRSSIEVWQRLKKQDEDAPVWVIDHLLQFPSELIPYANVMIWDPSLNDFRFLFWGSGRTEMMKYNYTGKPLSELKPAIYNDLVREELSEALTHLKPFKSSVQVVLENGTNTQVDKIRLPFLDTNYEATVVLSLDDVYQFLQRYYLTWHRRSE